MIGACPTPATGAAFLGTLLENIDCQARTIGQVGYQALADPGSPLAIALTALITIFIALFGIRMVLGQTPELRDGVLAVVKVGVVLMLATSWPAYRTLVYDVVIIGPGELAASIAQSSAIPGSDGSLTLRLQAADDAISQLVTTGSGRHDLGSRPAQTENGSVVPIQKESIADDLALGLGRTLYLAGVLGAFGIVRLGAGLLLALAPLFAGLLLFDATRSLFAGWLRTLFALVLAALGVMLVLGVELAVIEPWLADALAQRLSRIVTPEAPVELLVMALAFDVALIGCIWLSVRLAFAVHVPSLSRDIAVPEHPVNDLRSMLPQDRANTVDRQEGRPSRALAISDAVAMSQRRSVVPIASASGGADGLGGIQHVAPEVGPMHNGIIPLGRSLRRTRNRLSHSAAVRDRRS